MHDTLQASRPATSHRPHGDPGMHDLRCAFRQLTKSPGFTFVVVCSLGIGIGANTTVLCWMQNMLWRPLPGTTHQEQLVALVSNQGGGNTSLPDLRELGALDEVFVGAACSQLGPASLAVDENSAPEWVYGQATTANFFDLLGVKPRFGRTFRAPVLVISESLWRRRFAANPDVIGQVVDLNRHAFTIVGVVPARFAGTMPGLRCEFWAPISMLREVTARADNLESRNSRGYHNVARLRPGVTRSTADRITSHHI